MASRANIVRETAWGQIDGDLSVVEAALRLAMQLTDGDFQRWENEAHDAGYRDEFAITEAEVAAMTPEWRLALVARLIRSAAGMYGLANGYGPQPVGALSSHASPALLLRALSAAASGSES
jgi:hypothetical protein